jgi:hypothetical protein
MRRRTYDYDREAFARVLGQALGYLGLTGAVVWLLLRLG